jgi:hypothetical protein
MHIWLRNRGKTRAIAQRKNTFAKHRRLSRCLHRLSAHVATNRVGAFNIQNALLSTYTPTKSSLFRRINFEGLFQNATSKTQRHETNQLCRYRSADLRSWMYRQLWRRLCRQLRCRLRREPPLLLEGPRACSAPADGQPKSAHRRGNCAAGPTRDRIADDTLATSAMLQEDESSGALYGAVRKYLCYVG